MQSSYKTHTKKNRFLALPCALILVSRREILLLLISDGDADDEELDSSSFFESFFNFFLKTGTVFSLEELPLLPELPEVSLSTSTSSFISFSFFCPSSTSKICCFSSSDACGQQQADVNRNMAATTGPHKNIQESIKWLKIVSLILEID